mmetsp:Transcript_12273/g.25040  ORF Transcript_12273/g.25040 Transcript_12273/m.25040 type:complete len:441 (-) Transcript_12273:1352-2674(-)|eukprot:CAMPEP_0184689950 /NCGR_PEP_ID=MMETSP0312-20130426/30941_1 /TAXON_ID=31354 /ORGANISM="Compsopogon coeruleus, Strain SAG 36.94" /LENGTH=440 /DNA_ID=CAMNT_0027147359 /DNA_START=1353 /DNA_END=2675 /DNA_ORIENTATION=+
MTGQLFTRNPPARTLTSRHPSTNPLAHPWIRRTVLDALNDIVHDGVRIAEGHHAVVVKVDQDGGIFNVSDGEHIICVRPTRKALENFDAELAQTFSSGVLLWNFVALQGLQVRPLVQSRCIDVEIEADHFYILGPMMSANNFPEHAPVVSDPEVFGILGQMFVSALIQHRDGMSAFFSDQEPEPQPQLGLRCLPPKDFLRVLGDARQSINSQQRQPMADALTKVDRNETMESPSLDPELDDRVESDVSLRVSMSPSNSVSLPPIDARTPDRVQVDTRASRPCDLSVGISDRGMTSSEPRSVADRRDSEPLACHIQEGPFPCPRSLMDGFETQWNSVPDVCVASESNSGESLSEASNDTVEERDPGGIRARSSSTPDQSKLGDDRLSLTGDDLYVEELPSGDGRNGPGEKFTMEHMLTLLREQKRRRLEQLQSFQFHKEPG